MKPTSCDTFVALPPATAGGCTIFGKNSDRPSDEVQEVIYLPASDHPKGATVQCTYIEIPQTQHTHAVILSRPAWLWGAEMGANEHGVCIGNEAVWTKENSEADAEERLLGMDFVRLALERADTPSRAVDVLGRLLQDHGQGGACYAQTSLFTYQNSFLIVNQSEAWVFESAGRHWAAEQIKSGVRNISNQLTIRTKIDAMSVGLKEHAQKNGWWTPDQGEFDFAKAYSSDFEETELAPGETPSGRQLCGTKLLQEKSKGGEFSIHDMMAILRDDPSGICWHSGTTGSQVSVLPPAQANHLASHWFTATPDPSRSMFKPFLFCDGSTIGDKTMSPTFGDNDPTKCKPRFQTSVDRRHALYSAHEKLSAMLDKGDSKTKALLVQMHEMEAFCVSDVNEVSASVDPAGSARVADIFKHMVDLEMNFYSSLST